MRTLNVVMVGLLMLVSSTATADKLDDFRRAKSEKGCKSIPYSDMQGNCATQQDPVHEWCDGKKGPVTCGREGMSRDLTESLDKEKRKTEALKQKKRDLEDKRSRSSDDSEKSRLSSEIDAAEKEIYESEKGVDRIKDDLGKRKELVNNAIYNLGKCIDHRRAVMNVFAYAQDKIRNEDESPEIKEIARELRDRYEESKRGHAQAIEHKDNALNTCKKETL
jgi:hypothetical protein